METKDIIKHQREILNLTLEEIGKYVGVGKSTVKKWESGNIKNMRRDKIQKLSEILQVSPDYLMGWSNKGYSSKLKRLREKETLSLEDVANKTSLSLEDLTKIENNEYVKLTNENLCELSTVLNIDQDEMIKIFMNDLAYRAITSPDILDDKLANYVINFYEQIGDTTNKNEPNNNRAENMSSPQLTSEEKEMITAYRKLPRDKQIVIKDMIIIMAKESEEAAITDKPVKSA